MRAPFIILACAAMLGAGSFGSAVAADESKPAVASNTAAAPHHSKAELEAMLAKCSDEADAKGLSVARGKGAERKVFRRECMHRMGVNPR